MKAGPRLYAKLKKHRLRTMLGCLALACLACCLFGLNQQDNVREAVVRDEIASWRIGASDARPPAAVFVSFDGRDPNDNFIERFRESGPVVYKVSQGLHQMPGDIYTEFWVNPATGLQGNLVPVGRLVWLGPFMARVEVNYPTHGSVSTVTKSFSGWVVTARRQTWMH